MKKEKSSKPKAKRQQPASFDQFINPSLDEFKNDLQYDAKIGLAKRESNENLKKPFDLMIDLAIVCARHVTAILISLRNLKSLSASGKASFAERWMLCNGLYVLSAVNQRLRSRPDDEWESWPINKGHCFGLSELSTLLALDVVCTGVEVVAFEWIFRWIWSITGRPVDCAPVSNVIGNAVKDAGVSNFIQWSHRFNLNLFMYSDLFPWSGDVQFHDKIIPDECDPEVELDRVILELEFEHHEAVANLKKTKLSKRAARRHTKKKHKKSPLKKLPLKDNDMVVLELLENLPERKGLTGKEILQALDKKEIYVDQSTLTKSIIPRLQHNGYKIKNRRDGAGYYIEK